MERTMEHLKAAMRRLAAPKDRSYRDPYRLVINMAADRKACGVLGLGLLAVSVVTVTAAELFLPGRGMLIPLALSFGVGAGMFCGWGKVGALCHESLSSIRPLPPLDDNQRQSSKTRGASPTVSEEGVPDLETIEVAPNYARSETVERVGVNSERDPRP